MQVRHLVIAVLLASAGAAQAAGPAAPGQPTGWTVPGKAIGASDAVVLPMPAPLILEPVARPPVPVPEAEEVPEPSSIALLLAGAIAIGALRRRRSK